MALRFLNSGYFAGKVGIGTVSPTEKLQVYEGGLTAYKSYTTTNAGAILTAYQSTFSPFTKTTDLVAGSDGTVPSEIRFLTRTSGTSTIDERVRITSTGKVGIGTPSPSVQLDIEDSSNVLVDMNTTTANANTTIRLQESGTVKATIGYDGTNDGLILTTGGFTAGNGIFIDDSQNVGIGIATPTSKLHINQNVTNPDLDLPASFAVEIDSNHSGSAATTGDREQGGLYIDVDSSTTGGDTADEHRLYGINNNVNHTGDADLAYAISNRVEQNTTTGTTTNVIGSYSAAISDGGSGAVLTNITGVYGSVDMQDATPVSNSYGGQFLNNTNANRTGATTNSFGIRSEIQIGSTSAYTSLYAGHFSIDSNAAYTASNSYLLYLDYAGASLATDTYAIYSVDDVKSYHAGDFGIGTTSPGYKLDVEGSVNNADIGIRINNTFDDNDPASEPNAVLFLNAASNNGYLRVHGAPANTAAKHQIDLGSTAGSSFLTFSPSGEKMRITNDGNVGIGTNDPLSQLSIGSNAITTKKPTVIIADGVAGGSLVIRGLSPILSFDRTGASPENKILMDGAGLEFKTGTLDAEGDVDFKINPDGSLQLTNGSQISNQENTDIDSAAAEVVAQVAISYTAAFFDFVVKKGTNVRSGTVYACHDGTNVEFTETSTNDLGDTSDVTLSVDKTSTNLRLIATVTSDDWSVKSLIRAI